jgi:hypothetical protein
MVPEPYARRKALSCDDTTLVSDGDGYAIRPDNDNSIAHDYSGERRTGYEPVDNDPTDVAKLQLQNQNGETFITFSVPTDDETLMADVVPFCLGWLNSDGTKYGLTNIHYGSKILTFERQ